jgi:hypothetical protein
MDSSINAPKRIALPAFLNPNFITIEETVVLFISIIEKDEMAASIINVE